jgi:LuxR family transcriptional regulator, glucitol operon activator
VSQAPTRLSCFALISAIEEDFRNEIRSHVQANETFLPDDVRPAAFKRFQRDASRRLPGSGPSDGELLDYADFGELALVLTRFRGAYPTDAQADLAKLLKELPTLVPTRNRVCHSRPLEPNDFIELLAFCSGAVILAPFHLLSVSSALQRLKSSPSFVFHLSIPDFWQADDSSAVAHNLPFPEFDDTGFFGRQNDRRQVLTHLLSHHPVVSIVGEGGVGKTALAVRCLYDLLDAAAPRFDAIVWTSLKRKALGPGGVQQIQGAITNVLSLVHEIGDFLGVLRHDSLSVEGLLDEIRTYMEQFRLLLTVDNAETLAQDALRPLLVSVPPGSKVLLTSRVGLGEIELRYKLESLDPGAAVALMRQCARAQNIDQLQRGKDETLEKYCGALFRSPLLIRWFVQSV